MNNAFFAFGEILWDCLPSGRHAGGAPFNVAAHLAQLGVTSSLISTVGQDPLGDELLQIALDKKVETRFMGRARAGLATGTVMATLNEAGNATYDIVQPVAWDEIQVTPDVITAVASADALIFGSLAGRSPYNLKQLDQLLALKGPLKYFDVNLRAPFNDAALVLRLAQKADVIKLNHEEVNQLAMFVRTGQGTLHPDSDEAAIAEDCAVLAKATNTDRICVTRAENGAALWDRGTFICVPAPKITVKDTVGAGDAFMAVLMIGLTRGIDPRTTLETACELGAFVASHHGAIPLLSGGMVGKIRTIFGLGAAPSET